MLNEKKVEKIKLVVEVVIFLVIVLLTIVFSAIPALKKEIGSSDLYINMGNYSSIIGIEIEDEADFALVLDKDKIVGVLFFNSDSLILYNRNIEKKTIDEGLKIISKLLDEYDINNSIKIINYSQNNDTYDRIRLYMNNRYGSSVVFVSSKLEDKAKALNLSGFSSEEEIVELLYKYSIHIVKQYKNELLVENIYDLDLEIAKKYASNIYKKLLVYATYVSDQEIDSEQYPIQLIDVDAEVIGSMRSDRIVPDSNSWYYIKSGKVYSYIEFVNNNDAYGFCFSGSFDSMKEGNCNEGFS